MVGEHESAERNVACEVHFLGRVGGGRLDQLSERAGAGRVVIVSGREVYACDARRFAEERPS